MQPASVPHGWIMVLRYEVCVYELTQTLASSQEGESTALVQGCRAVATIPKLHAGGGQTTDGERHLPC